MGALPWQYWMIWGVVIAVELLFALVAFWPSKKGDDDELHMERM